MTDFNSNSTMRKLGRLNAITSDTAEGKEISELVRAIPIMKYFNPYVLASYAYALGMDRGKKLERQRIRQQAREKARVLM